ncbi:hypothetical protein Syun_003353 [Stephania yunnanensis]|uniref:Xylanase inhibitor N-terminal domain-containing protein n=1 Tax=Stephania yunnanensis TaxID=152371 RepID=A0AAP0L198_9MAGN
MSRQQLATQQLPSVTRLLVHVASTASATNHESPRQPGRPQVVSTLLTPSTNPLLSSSSSSISRDNPQCRSLDVSACRNNSCLYQVSYGDDSYTVGYYVFETLTFSDDASVDKIAIGCGHNVESLFVGAAGFTRGSQPASLINSLPRPPPR